MRSPFRLALASLLAVAVAGAQEVDPVQRSEAKALKDLGTQAMTQGEYARALTYFVDAYRHFPSPNLRYNQAQALLQLRRDAEAAAALEAFLVEAVDAPPGNRQFARRQLGEMGQRLGRVAVRSEVDGADVVLDGKTVGRTPLAAPLWVFPGPHALLLRKRGHDDAARDLVVSAGEQQTVEAAPQARAVDDTPVAPPPPVAPPRADPQNAHVALERPPRPPTDRVPLVRRWWLWTTIALATAITVGVSLGIAAAGFTKGVPRGDVDPWYVHF